MRNSRSPCGCGGAQVFECVHDSMPRIERRRLTLDDRDDRRRDRVQRERPKVGSEFSHVISGRKKISDSTSGRKKKILPKTTSGRRTERKRTEDDETEQRRDERVLLDLVFDRLGGLSGRPSGRPVSDLPKTPPMGPGPAGAQNRHILNRTSIEKSSDSDGRRIREFSSSRTRPDLLLFRALGGTDFRVRFLRVFASRISFCLRRFDRELLN